MLTQYEQHPGLVLFAELLVAAPSGREQGVAAVIRQKLDEMGVAHETDGAGNVLVRLNGRSATAPLCCLASHMDEIGMVVTRILPNGTLQVERSGGLFAWKLGEGPVELVGDKTSVVGVLSMGSTHTAERAGGVAWGDVRVLTGLTPAQLAEAGVRVGTTAVPVRARRGPVLFGDPADPLVGAWTFDDRLGCVTLLRLLQWLQQTGQEPFHPTVIAFTTQEEVGGIGAKWVAQKLQPEIFIAVDGAPIPPETSLLLDGRPAAWSKDRLTHYDQRLLADLSAAAERVGTGLQTAVFTSAASDASLVAYSGLAARVACMGQVRENSHGYEVARLAVFDNMLHTLAEFVVMGASK